MGWSGSLTQNSVLGSKILFTPDASGEGEYTVSSFAAPRKGVYRFELKGSGGTAGIASGGAGGMTDGYLLLERTRRYLSARAERAVRRLCRTAAARSFRTLHALLFCLSPVLAVLVAPAAIPMSIRS